jgi:ankyrin repeat protein
MAIQLNLPEYISFALHRGANINVQDDKGNTPLHEAVRLVNLPAVKLLLDCGANIMITNKSGETPSDILNKFIKGDHSNNRTNSNLTKACFIKELFDEARQRTKQSNADKKDGI